MCSLTSPFMELDILFFAAHPDDVELACAGTVIKLSEAGKKVGIIDLTRGEMGSRGTPELRAEEAAAAAKIMGVAVRENLAFRDGFFANDEPHQLAVIRKIRQYRPAVVVANALKDRHPDHGRGATLLKEAFFKSGLKKIETQDDAGNLQAHFRPKRLFHFIQDQYIEPDFVIDITPYHERKMEAIRAYGSQFYNPAFAKSNTYISSEDFWHFLEARARDMGHKAGVTFGEGYTYDYTLKVKSLLDLV